VVVLAVAIVVMFAAEAAVRVVSGRLPEPSVWYHPSAQVKVRQMDELLASGVSADIAIVGSSQAAMAIDPVLLAERLDSDSVVYNAALLAGYPTVTERFAPEEVVPRLRPPTVIVGVSSNDVQTSELPRYDEARATDPALIADVDRVLSARSALIRYRRELADPTGWGDLLAGVEGEVAFYERTAIGPAGSWIGERASRCDRPLGESAEVRAARDDVVWSTNPERETALWQTVDRLRSSGSRVVVVVIPVSDCWRIDLQNDDADADGRAVIAAGAQRHGVPVIDLSEEVRARHLFTDRTHMSVEGEREFTMKLAGRLATLPP